MATVPIVAEVATLEPDTAANTPQATMLEWVSPPGSTEVTRAAPR